MCAVSLLLNVAQTRTTFRIGRQFCIFPPFMNMHLASVSDLGLATASISFPHQQVTHPIVSSITMLRPLGRHWASSCLLGRKAPFETMKTPRLRSPRTRLLTLIAVASVIALIHPSTGNGKDNVDLQFWDMIWVGPQYT